MTKPPMKEAEGGLIPNDASKSLYNVASLEPNQPGFNRRLSYSIYSVTSLCWLKTGSVYENFI